MTELLHDWGDAVVALLMLATVMIFIDWRLGRLFARHERVEQEANARLVQTAEVHADLALEAGKRAREALNRIDLVEGRVSLVQDDVRMHDRRLGAVEERLMRAAMLAPPPRRPPDDEGEP